MDKLTAAYAERNRLAAKLLAEPSADALDKLRDHNKKVNRIILETLAFGRGVK